jgi:hypothetical protein
MDDPKDFKLHLIHYFCHDLKVVAIKKIKPNRFGEGRSGKAPSE